MFGFELWYNGELVHEEHGFNTEVEAKGMGKSEALYRKELWENDGAWKSDDSMDLFDVVVV